MTVEAALTQIANLLTAETDRPAYVYPKDFGSISLGSLPAVVVMGRVAITNQFGDWSGCEAYHDWEAEIFLLLHEGEIGGFNNESAAVEALHEGWPKRVYDALMVDRWLGGTVEHIGAVSGDMTLTYVIEHLVWQQRVFWGIHFNVPIRQRVT